MARGVSATAVLALGLSIVAPRLPVQAAVPYFEFRGIIEGYYGTPFAHTDRLDLVHWEASHGMNIFVHAPKSDPYVRTLWRHQYPSDQLQPIVTEIALARSLGVLWVPDVGPGVPLIPSPNIASPDRDICFSCPADVQTLVDRYRPFVSAGARAIMLSFDDNQKVSTHPEDTAAYGTGDAAYGVMTADLLNRLLVAYPGVTLITVPTDYSGSSSTPYLQAFGQHLDPRVVVMWTGTQTVSPSIRGSDAEAFDRVVGRRVVVWDNYPVNDYTGGIFGAPTDLHQGPVMGRGPDLVGRVRGLLANPMAEWQTNKVPLATVADDLNDPYHYQPETSWRRALTEFGGSNASWLTKLAENTRSSPLGQAESVMFAPLTHTFTTAFAGPDWPAPADALDRELTAEQISPDRLTVNGFNPQYLQQAGGFLTRLRLNAGAGLSALALLRAERPALQLDTAPGSQAGLSVTGSAAPPNPAQALALEQQLAAAQQQTLGDYHNVHGERFAFNVDGSVVTGQNLMDGFVSQAEQATTAWLPRAPAASSSVTLTVDGKPVTNPFQLQLAPGQSIHVVATDGAGGQTGRVLAVPSTPATAGSPGPSLSPLPVTSGGSLTGAPRLLALALAALAAGWCSRRLWAQRGVSVSRSLGVGDA